MKINRFCLLFNKVTLFCFLMYVIFIGKECILGIIFRSFCSAYCMCFSCLSHVLKLTCLKVLWGFLFCFFKIGFFSTARVIQSNPVSQNKQTKKIVCSLSSVECCVWLMPLISAVPAEKAGTALSSRPAWHNETLSQENK